MVNDESGGGTGYFFHMFFLNVVDLYLFVVAALGEMCIRDRYRNEQKQG